MVEEARLEHLLVQARTVKAASHRCFNIKLERFIGGRGDNTLGVKALVENKTTKHGLAVDLQAALLGQLDLAQAEIAVHNVNLFARHQFKNKIVKSALAARPKVRLGKLDFNKCGGRCHFCGGRAHQFALIISFYAQRVIALRAFCIGFDNNGRF